MRFRGFSLLLIVALGGPVDGADWPAWRGVNGDGLSPEKNLPTTWTAVDNIRWKLALPGPGNSSPIVWGERVFITQSLDHGHKRAPPVH